MPRCRVSSDFGFPSCLARLAGQGAHVIVRVNTSALPLRNRDGSGFDLCARLRRLTQPGEVKQYEVVVIAGKTEVPGRLCILRKSETQCRRTLRRIRRKTRQGGPEPKAETLVCANFVIVFTMLDESELSARQVLEYYRLRWQIELVFKRLKTVLRAGHVPKYDDQSSKAWLYGKLLVALLAEKMIRVGRAVSPWGYLLPGEHENEPEGEAAQPLA